MATLEHQVMNVTDAGDFDRAVLQGAQEPFERRAFLLADIDIDRSRRVLNQVRLGLGAYDQAHVDDLTTKLEQGVKLPPGITYKDDQGHWVILSGNHRYPAHEQAGKGEMEFYVASGLEGLPLSDPRVQEIAFLANVGHGKPVEQEHRIEQAARLVEAGTHTIRDAAEMLSVPEGKLRDHVEKLRARRRLQDLEVDTKQIPVTAQRRLASLPSDRVIKSAAAIVPLMTKKTEEVNALVVALNDARTEEQALEIVKQAGDTLQAAGAVQARARKRKTGAMVSPRIARLDGALGLVGRFDPAEVASAALTAEYREHLAQRLTTALNVLSEVQKAL